MFKIMNFNSENGEFATVDGLAINSREHFTIAYQATETSVARSLARRSPNGKAFLGSD
jgi:hypothetical protein